MAASPVVLEVKGVTKSYREASGGPIGVLDTVSFSIERGEMVSFMGPSGSGKTTLLQICGLLDRADSGDVEIGGTSTCHLSERRLTEIRKKNIGFVYQMHHLFPEFSAIENVELPLLIGGASKKSAEKSASEVLERLGMLERRISMPSELSGGERQRVAIARAVVTRPAIVLADEPTGNLDSENSGKVMNLLLETLRTYGTGMLIVTHNWELSRSTDRTLIIENRKILEYSGR
ncbi:MAG: ABC transporter ATP-binding protein [Rickettsiales bacterium]|nr:ABC transporter ATP-binding protein [Rickettsiales bacterium]